jgi:hypothetical protein
LAFWKLKRNEERNKKKYGRLYWEKSSLKCFIMLRWVQQKLKNECNEQEITRMEFNWYENLWEIL